MKNVLDMTTVHHEEYVLTRHLGIVHDTNLKVGTKLRWTNLKSKPKKGEKMYESPITIKTEEIARNIMDKQEEYILTQVQMCVDVDKDELIKALEYDRGQYEKGYADGRASAIKRGHWVTITDEPFADRYKCSECDEEPLIVDCEFQLTPYCPFCGAKMDEVEDD